ncbi:hypothetical protein [Marinobacter gelidimuriae]|jgi:hypothetical protein|uniref:hypothetical protein n=1 Tax=Marinobacter gelidimuriae TaxID=2739064 RepID=UPI00035F22C1|nr:hypothetical protein [Marinobacter gelidimuriae]
MSTINTRHPERRTLMAERQANRVSAADVQQSIRHYLDNDPEFLIDMMDRSGLLNKMRHHIDTLKPSHSVSPTVSADGNHLFPDFKAIENRRIGDLSPAQQSDALELWLRKEWPRIGTDEDCSGHHIRFLLDRLTDLRTEVHHRLDQQQADPMTRLARRKAEQLGTLAGVLVRTNSDDRLAAVSELGRVTWLKAESALGPQSEPSNEIDLLADEDDEDNASSPGL